MFLTLRRINNVIFRHKRIEANYLKKCFLKYIDERKVHRIFEFGSRDALDSISLHQHFKCKVYTFECNPLGITKCLKNLENFNTDQIELIQNAVHDKNETTSFHSVNVKLLNNDGASSMYKLNFKDRLTPENTEDCQTEINVKAIRLDTFCEEQKINAVDLLCIDLQGHELCAIKGLGRYLETVKYIMTEAAMSPLHYGGCTLKDLEEHLIKYGFVMKHFEAQHFMGIKNGVKHYWGDALFINMNE